MKYCEAEDPKIRFLRFYRLCKMGRPGGTLLPGAWQRQRHARGGAGPHRTRDQTGRSLSLWTLLFDQGEHRIYESSQFVLVGWQRAVARPSVLRHANAA